MQSEKRQMRLTRELVGRVAPFTGLKRPLAKGFRVASDADYEAIVSKTLEQEGCPKEVWIFAYGSLIWKPCFEHVEKQIALLEGWSRSFCLGWDRRFRGSPDRPGLMMALDRGGACTGVAYRLPPNAIAENLDLLFRREMPHRVDGHHPLPAKWIDATTSDGPVRCLTFVINRESAAYVSQLPAAEIADALSRSAGELGTMAEYLQSTVEHLEELGIHDEHLWMMQEMVAERIEAATNRLA